MSVRKIKNHGKWVWQARVAYKGLRRAAFRATRDEARDAEDDLRRELKAEVERDSAWVFPGPDGRPYDRSYIGRVFRRAARAAGLRDFHFHDLRHHGATMALNRGFSAPIVMALGGWKTERMMRRYAAVTDATLRAAAEAVAGSEPWQQARNLTEIKA